MGEFHKASNAESIINYVRSVSGIEVRQLPDPDSPVIATVPAGYEIQDLREIFDAWLDHPRRIEGTSFHSTSKSLIDHANRFRIAQSVIFADPDGQVTVSYDYVSKSDGECPGAAGNRKHKAVYKLEKSPEWSTWTDSKADLSQEQFAEFLQEHIDDVIDPANAGEGAKRFADQIGCELGSPQKLLSVAQGLTLKIDAQVSGAHNLSTGEISASFSEGTETSIRVPGAFSVGIPVFKDGPRYELVIRLRYRLKRDQNSGATLRWRILPHRADKVADAAFAEVAEKIAAETGLPLFYGKE